MRNKKLISLSVMGVLAIGSIASTLAWFVSTDKAVSSFEMLKQDSEYINKDIEIQKAFNEEKMTNIVPGSSISSTFSVKNISNYDVLTRVKFDKVWKYNDEIVTHYKLENVVSQDANGNNVENKRVVYLNSDNARGDAEAKSLNLDFINLNFGSNLIISNYTSNKWACRLDPVDNQNWYYYNGVLKSNSSDELIKTKPLLQSIDISNNIDNVYKNLTFDIEITAESVQASHGAISEVWPSAPDKIKELGK